jgi:hypothetical protein
MKHAPNAYKKGPIMHFFWRLKWTLIPGNSGAAFFNSTYF